MHIFSRFLFLSIFLSFGFGLLEIPRVLADHVDGHDVPDGAGSESIEFELDNPGKFGTVEELLGGVLDVIRSMVAILAVLFIVIGAVLYITSGGDSGRTELAKKAIWAAVVGLAIAIAAPSFLKEVYQAIGSGEDPSGTVDASTPTLSAIAMNVLRILLSVVGILSIIMLVIGGIIYILSAGDSQRIESAKKIVVYSVIGLVVALTALVVVNQIVGILV